MEDLSMKGNLDEEQKSLLFAHSSSVIQTSTEREPKYMMVRHSLYEYIDGKANRIEWQSVLTRYAEKRCRIVVPILQSTGFYVVGYETQKNRLKIEGFWHRDRFHMDYGEVLSVTRNHLYAIDSARGVRSLTEQGGRRLMELIWEKIPDEFDEVFNVTQNDNFRFFVYGKIGGQNTIKFIDNGPPLLMQNASRLDECLDIVHIPFTKTIYLVWRGHIEVRKIEMVETFVDSPHNVRFLPRRTQIEKVLHPFSDSRGLVVYVRNTWSNKESIISYNFWTSRWKILVNLDVAQLDYVENISTDLEEEYERPNNGQNVIG